MAPIRNKKRKSSTESDATRSQTIAIKSPRKTPMRSPHKRIVGITEAQKQALIDNLQLEVTERARKLRAQYALQAQSLRTRIELRINRIPMALRKVNMGELIEKYNETSKPEQKLALEDLKPTESNIQFTVTEKPVVSVEGNGTMAAPVSRGLKRNSHAMALADKENMTESAREIPNPKKRTRVAKGPSRQVTNPSTVLSPKSANSRTLPQSPARPALGSMQKSYSSHPVSPLKPLSPIKAGSPAKAAAAAATASLAAMIGEKPRVGRPKAGGTGRKVTNPPGGAKGPAVRAKRGAGPIKEPEDVRKVSNTSNISSASNTTTIVKNAKKIPTTASKRKDVGVRAVGKKVTTTTEAPPLGRRVLRKRA